MSDSTSGSAMRKRIEIQGRAIEDLYSYGNEIIVAEIKTGTGKTKILLDLAEKHVSAGRNVVISTSNNFLARNFFEEAEKFGHSRDRMFLMVGRNNYVDENLVLKAEFLDGYGISLDAAKEWLAENQRMPLVDLFLRDFYLPDEVRSEIVLTDTEQRTLAESIGRIDGRVEEGEKGSVFVTNHYYLIHLLKYANRQDLPVGKNAVFLFDEAHQIDDAARSVFSHTFSMNYLRAGLRRLLDAENISKTMRSRIHRKIFSVEETMSLIQNLPFGEGEGIGTSPAVAKEMRALILDKEMETIYRFAKRNEHGCGALFSNEFQEAHFIFGNNSVSPGYISFSLSAIKRYPSFSIETENRTLGLRSVMSRINSAMVLVSGTVRVSHEVDIHTNEWSFNKMGLLRFRKAESGSREGGFNSRIDRMKFYNYPYIFDRNDVRFVCAKSEFLLPPRVKMTRGAAGKENMENTAAYRRWVSKLAHYLEERMWGNTVCLMSSFENSEMMAEEIKKLIGDEYRIVLHRKGKTMGRTISEYRAAIDRGEKAILIGGMPFYTGIDLHGKYLNTLFVGKLPIEPKPTLVKKTLSMLPSLQRDIRNKSLITFRQGIGRAKRREEDRVLVVVADPRIHNARYRRFKDFLDEVGVEIQEEE